MQYGIKKEVTEVYGVEHYTLFVESADNVYLKVNDKGIDSAIASIYKALDYRKIKLRKEDKYLLLHNNKARVNLVHAIMTYSYHMPYSVNQTTNEIYNMPVQFVGCRREPMLDGLWYTGLNFTERWFEKTIQIKGLTKEDVKDLLRVFVDIEKPYNKMHPFKNGGDRIISLIDIVDYKRDLYSSKEEIMAIVDLYTNWRNILVAVDEVTGNVVSRFNLEYLPFDKTKDEMLNLKKNASIKKTLELALNQINKINASACVLDDDNINLLCELSDIK